MEAIAFLIVGFAFYYGKKVVKYLGNNHEDVESLIVVIINKIFLVLRVALSVVVLPVLAGVLAVIKGTKKASSVNSDLVSKIKKEF